MTTSLRELPLHSDADVARARREVATVARNEGLSALACTKLATAASELARNTLVHGRGGLLRIHRVEEKGTVGIRLRFVDHGPGIPSVDEAMRDGFSTRKSMGLGLGGARRLVDELVVRTDVAVGTTVDVTVWK